MIQKPKHPTLKEKIDVYEQLLHDIQLHAVVTMRPEAVRALVGKICAWSYSHRAGNGELSEKELQERIDHAFWALKRR